VFTANSITRSAEFYNCLFVRCGVESDADRKLYNCTAVGSGRGFTAYSGTIFLYNCISWSNNLADSGVSAFNSCGVGNTYTNTLLGNTTNNPMLVDYGTGNYRLQANSPGVNSGTNQEWMTGKVDLDGRTRIRYGKVDMGAYELIYDGTIYKFH